MEGTHWDFKHSDVIKTVLIRNKLLYNNSHVNETVMVICHSTVYATSQDDQKGTKESITYID